MRQDVEAIVADGRQDLIADPAWIEALPQLLHEPLPEGVGDGSGHRLRGLGQLRRPVASAVEDVRVHETRTQNRDAGPVSTLLQLQVYPLRQRHHAELRDRV